jgi:hypothetical protein
MEGRFLEQMVSSWHRVRGSNAGSLLAAVRFPREVNQAFAVAVLCGRVKPGNDSDLWALAGRVEDWRGVQKVQPSLLLKSASPPP